MAHHGDDGTLGAPKAAQPRGSCACGWRGESVQQLNALAFEAPLAALKGVAVLERVTRRIGREAAYGAEADEVSWEEIGQALGLDEKTARSRLLHYSLRS
ncbi:hypothetical protein [Streptomyces sp. NPDC059850]|uniref:hypothetical protein n=1 Tax=Streptomyces sp. NPDC059850 TaxID=3346970 RepID=UPI0036698424